MKKVLIKKILVVAGSATVVLAIVLVVHIYQVTRPKAPDATTVAMARIDIRQEIDVADADKAVAWLYQQDGVDRVMYNPGTRIIVFTYKPVAAKADVIVSDFKQTFDFTAERFVPSEEEMKNGCPVAVTSVSYKTYNFFKQLF